MGAFRTDSASQRADICIRTFNAAYALILCDVPASIAHDIVFHVANVNGDIINVNVLAGLVPASAAALVARFPEYVSAATAAYRMNHIAAPPAAVVAAANLAGVPVPAQSWQITSPEASYYAARIALHLHKRVTATVNEIAGAAMFHADEKMTNKYPGGGYNATQNADMLAAPVNAAAAAGTVYASLYLEASAFMLGLSYNPVPVSDTYCPSEMTTPADRDFVFQLMGIDLTNLVFTAPQRSLGQTIVESFLAPGTKPYEYLEAAGNPLDLLTPVIYDQRKTGLPVGNKEREDYLATVTGYPKMETYR